MGLFQCPPEGVATFYDAQLSQVKTISIDVPKVPNYSVMRARKGRIAETESGEENVTARYEEMSREDIILYLTSWALKDGIYTDADGIMWFVSDYYDYYDYAAGGNYIVDKTRPENGYYLTQDNQVYSFYKDYKTIYDGDWHEAQVNSDNSYYIGAESIDIYSYDAGIRLSESGCRFTQTLFNSDDKFEYLYETWEYLPTDTSEYDRDYDEVVDSIRIRYGVVKTGVELRQEDGTVLWKYDYNLQTEWSGEFFVYDINGCRYLALEDKVGDDYKIIFFSIDKSGNSIQEVNSMPGFLRAYPNPVRNGEVVTMELPEPETDGAQRNVSITGMDGRTVRTIRVGTEERSVQVPLSQMSSGVYNFTLTENGRVVENSRIVVR